MRKLIVSIFMLLSASFLQAGDIYTVPFYQYKKIQAIFPQKNRVWFGSSGGLIYYEKKSGRYILVRDAALLQCDIYDIQPWGDYLYLATSSGLVQYHPLTGNVKIWDKKSGLADNRLSSIAVQNNTIYCYYGKAEAGVTLFYPENGKTELIEALKDIHIYKALPDNDILWMTGSKSIFKYDMSSKALQELTRRDIPELETMFFDENPYINSDGRYIIFKGTGSRSGYSLIYNREKNTWGKRLSRDPIPLAARGELYWIGSSYDIVEPSGYASYYVFDIPDQTQMVGFNTFGQHICMKSDGDTLWIGTTSGLIRYKNGGQEVTFTAFEPEFRNMINAFASDNKYIYMDDGKLFDFHTGGIKTNNLFFNFNNNENFDNAFNYLRYIYYKTYKKKINEDLIIYLRKEYDNPEDYPSEKIPDDPGSTVRHFYRNGSYLIFNNKIYAGGYQQGYEYEGSIYVWCFSLGIKPDPVSFSYKLTPIYQEKGKLLSEGILGLASEGKMIFFGTDKGLSVFDMKARSWKNYTNQLFISDIFPGGNSVYFTGRKEYNQLKNLFSIDGKLSRSSFILSNTGFVVKTDSGLIASSLNKLFLVNGNNNVLRIKLPENIFSVYKLMPADNNSFWLFSDTGFGCFSTAGAGKSADIKRELNLKAVPLSLSYNYTVTTQTISYYNYNSGQNMQFRWKNRFNDRLRVTISSTFPPLHFMNEKKELSGFEVDLAREIAKRLNLEVEFVNPQELKMNNIDTLLDGKSDVIINCFTVTGERKKQVRFTESYLETSLKILVRKSLLAAGIDLNKKKIAFPGGLLTEKALKTYFTNSILIPFPDSQECFKALEKKKADAVVNDDVILNYYAHNNDDYAVLDEIVHIEGIENQYAAATLPGSPLYEPVNNIIQKMISDGFIDELFRKWLQ